MTKRGPLLLALAFLASLAAPPALAHGAPAARELDARVLLDDDGGLAYGGCIEVCNPVAPPEGLDVLALDVREAWLGDAPALVFRIVFQFEAVHDGRGFVLELTAQGTTQELVIDSPDGSLYTSTAFDRLVGPVDVGDGHPKALDAWISTARLGLAPGDAVTNLALRSTHHEEPDDVMPGTWFSQGLEVPHLPHDPADPMEVLAQPAAGTYTLKGPAPILTLTPATALVDLATDGNLTFTVTNPLTTLAQFTRVALQPPAGVRVTLQGGDTEGQLELNLDPGASRTFTVTVDGDSASGAVQVVTQSDLGGRAQAAFDVLAAPTPVDPLTPEPTPSHDDAEEAPAPGAVPAGLALLALAFGRRGKAQRDDGARPTQTRGAP